METQYRKFKEISCSFSSDNKSILLIMLTGVFSDLQNKIKRERSLLLIFLQWTSTLLLSPHVRSSSPYLLCGHLNFPPSEGSILEHHLWQYLKLNTVGMMLTILPSLVIFILRWISSFFRQWGHSFVTYVLMPFIHC